jgi:hypothetical protein
MVGAVSRSGSFRAVGQAMQVAQLFRRDSWELQASSATLAPDWHLDDNHERVNDSRVAEFGKLLSYTDLKLTLLSQKSNLS